MDGKKIVSATAGAAVLLTAVTASAAGAAGGIHETVAAGGVSAVNVPRLLGWVSVVLLTVLLMRFPLLRIKSKRTGVTRLKKISHRIHLPAAGLLLGTGLIHGVLMLEGVGWHTGTLLWLLLLLSAMGGLLGKKFFPRTVLRLHQWTGFAILMALVVHLVKPWLFS